MKKRAPPGIGLGSGVFPQAWGFSKVELKLALEPSHWVPFLSCSWRSMLCPRRRPGGQAGHLCLPQSPCSNPQKMGNPRGTAALLPGCTRYTRDLARVGWRLIPTRSSTECANLGRGLLPLCASPLQMLWCAHARP